MNDPITFGREEGEQCRRHGCEGHMIYSKIRGCTCFKGHAPCSACTDQKLECTLCDLIVVYTHHLSWWWYQDDLSRTHNVEAGPFKIEALARKHYMTYHYSRKIR